MIHSIQYWISAKNKQWYFHLKAKNGKVIAASEGYLALQGCEKTMNGIIASLAYTIVPKQIKQPKKK